MSRRDGRVRFLVSRAALDADALERYSYLERRFPETFEAWVSDQSSIFRLVTVDERLSIFTHYGHEVIDEQGQNMKGWQSPQLLVDHSAEWSLAVPLRRVFQDTLARAARVDEVLRDDPFGSEFRR